MKLAIIGATGLVGEEILKVLKERNINFKKLYLVASKASRNIIKRPLLTKPK